MTSTQKPHLIFEILIFLFSAGGMGYTAQNSLWVLFTICMIASAVLLWLLRWYETSPFRAYLADLEVRRNRIAVSFEKWGVKDVFNMRYPDEITRRNTANQNLIKSGKSFALLAETAASYIDPTNRRHWDILKPKLDAGHALRLLILDPFCPSKSLRNQQNGITKSIDPKLNIDRLVELKKLYHKVDVRITTEPYCSLFITDNGLIYDPYHVGKHGSRIENYFLAIEMSKDGDGDAYWLLSSHFDTLWEKAILLDTWRRNNKGKIS